MRTLFSVALLALAADMAEAHAGHDMLGAHWHVSDLFLPLVIAATATATWFTRKK